jgi:NADPH:quinone reductase
VKALRFESYGPPSVLQFREIEAPALKPDEVLVRVLASGVTRIDVGAVSGLLKSEMPRTPGREFAGVVVQGVRKDVEVWGSWPEFGITRDGAHAEYVALPLAWLADKPRNLSMAQAASIGIPFLASYESLIKTGGIREGDRILITGVNGQVGRAACQIARWKKAFIIGADITPEPSAADIFIDLTKQDLVDEVNRLTGGVGVDLILDGIGSDLFESCIRSLCIGGKQIAIASGPNHRVQFDLQSFVHRRTQLLGVSTIDMPGVEVASLLDELRPAFEEGHLHPPNFQIHSFDNAIAVYTSVANRTSQAQQVLTLS